MLSKTKRLIYDIQRFKNYLNLEKKCLNEGTRLRIFSAAGQFLRKFLAMPLISKQLRFFSYHLKIQISKILAAGEKLSTSTTSKRLTPIEKLQQSEPYRFFLSTVYGISDNYNQINAMSLKGILIYLIIFFIKNKSFFRNSFDRTWSTHTFSSI